MNKSIDTDILKSLYIPAKYEIDEQGRRNAKCGTAGTTLDIEDNIEITWLSYEGKVNIGQNYAQTRHGKSFVLAKENENSLEKNF